MQPVPNPGSGQSPASWAVTIAGEELLCEASGALWWPDRDTLIVSDLHLEKGSSLARRGFLLPPYDTGATLRLLEAAIAMRSPSRVIALGDSFHDNSGHERLEATDRERLEAMMAEREWIWIAGNHDELAPVGLGGTPAGELHAGNLVFRHEPGPPAGTQGQGQPGEIAGHLHPCARVVRSGRAIRRACFVHDGERLIMPALGAYTGGLSISDHAFGGLFDPANCNAILLGPGRVYPVSMQQLAPGSRIGMPRAGKRT